MTQGVGRKHLVIPDTQIKPDADLSYINWVGQYARDKQPDVIVNLGDWWDMPSLSSYDKGKKSFEGRRYAKDIAAGQKGMDIFFEPINEFNAHAKANKKKLYQPELHFLEGNHEERISRVAELQPEFEGTVGFKDLHLEKWGWKVHRFLEVVVIDGIAYSHYFVSGILGRPCTTARSIISKHHMSAVCGHQQGHDIAYGKRADGQQMTAIICGSYYPHDEAYLTPSNNQHFRGIYMLHEVQDGAFYEMAVSLSFLKRKYGKEN